MPIIAACDHLRSVRPKSVRLSQREMATAMVEDTFEDDLLSSMTTEDIFQASRLLDNEIGVLKKSMHNAHYRLHGSINIPGPPSKSWPTTTDMDYTLHDADSLRRV
ncbi:hypothetical protein QYF36_003379 [Acer negundo]|nr:hypothetical protein QYF36_003379 [Acer negundo]